MNEGKNINLPVVPKNNLPYRITKAKPRIIEILKKIGKVAEYSAIGVAGLGITTLGGPIASIIGLGGLTVGTVRAYQHLAYRNQKDLAFSLKYSPLKNETKISQDAFRLDLISQMRNMNRREKAAYMALQMIEGFRRQKKELYGKETIEGKNGSRIYDKKFSTITHSLNLRSFTELEELGYIQIEKREFAMQRTLTGNKPKKSLLIMPKLGFGELGAVGDIVKNIFKGDKDALESKKKQMEYIQFRLTDKPIDFEELYEIYKKDDQKYSEDTKKLLNLLFNEKEGILMNGKVDLTEKGIKVRNNDTTFAKMIKIKENADKSTKDFKQRNNYDVNLDELNLQNREKNEKENIKVITDEGKEYGE